MTLFQHITQNHAGNVSHFARSIGVSRVQVVRWIAYDCEWDNGRILRPLFDVRNCQ